MFCLIILRVAGEEMWFCPSLESKSRNHAISRVVGDEGLMGTESWHRAALSERGASAKMPVDQK